jgi:hypothetical protein
MLSESPFLMLQSISISLNYEKVSSNVILRYLSIVSGLLQPNKSNFKDIGFIRGSKLIIDQKLPLIQEL